MTQHYVIRQITILKLDRHWTWKKIEKLSEIHLNIFANSQLKHEIFTFIALKHTIFFKSIICRLGLYFDTN